MLRNTTDRARPGLVAVYDIRPGNGAGQFLQPRSPHGAIYQNRRIPYLQFAAWIIYMLTGGKTMRPCLTGKWRARAQ